MQRKIVVFDLDDTLLNSDGEVSEYTLSVLKTASQMGHIIVINTARNQMRSTRIFDLIKPDFAIYNGGAQIVDRDGKTVRRYEITRDTCNAIVPDLLTSSEKFSMQNDDWFYSSNADYKADDVRFFDFASEQFPSGAYKIIAFSHKPDELAALAERFDLDFVAYFGGPFCRFTSRGVTKAFGNRELANMLSMDISDVIAFGDDMGDLQMIDEAGVGVLMKNAKDEIKSGRLVSDFTNDEDGVAHFLADYLGIDM